jgi:hypothetical protein
MIVAPSCLNITSFVAILEQCTQRFLLSLTSIFGAGCTLIGVYENIQTGRGRCTKSQGFFEILRQL